MKKLEFFEQLVELSEFSEGLSIELFDFSEKEQNAFLERNQHKLRSTLAKTNIFADSVEIVNALC